MIDFTSSLYLGLKHDSKSLPAWEQLTLGKPAVLEAAPGSGEAEAELARLSGCECAALAPSTLHLFWDLFSILAARGMSVFVDQEAYPIARWGAERAAALGVLVQEFPHQDALALRRMLKDVRRGPIVIVADGYCPSCSAASPLRAYLELAYARDGLLVIDDTQALGIFGESPRAWVPYGIGGGGSLRLAGLRDPRLVLASSLAKGFGVPLAVLSGSKAMVKQYRDKSQTRVHCSPPSVAATTAALHAFNINRHCGDSLRLRLAQRVARFRNWLMKFGLTGSNGLFPVQSLHLPPRVDTKAFFMSLMQAGIRTALQRGGHKYMQCITFVITAQHSESEIDHAAACLRIAAERHIN